MTLKDFAWLIEARPGDRSELLERLFGLDREADGDVGLAVEDLKQVTAEQAMELALGAPLGHQLDAPVAGIALGTGDVGFPHARNMRPGRFVGQ